MDASESFLILDFKLLKNKEFLVPGRGIERAQESV
jgi:hypothetical protein